MEDVHVSALILVYFTWSWIFPSGARYIPNISISSSDFR